MVAVEGWHVVIPYRESQTLPSQVTQDALRLRRWSGTRWRDVEVATAYNASGMTVLLQDGQWQVFYAANDNPTDVGGPLLHHAVQQGDGTFAPGLTLGPTGGAYVTPFSAALGGDGRLGIAVRGSMAGVSATSLHWAEQATAGGTWTSLPITVAAHAVDGVVQFVSYGQDNAPWVVYWPTTLAGVRVLHRAAAGWEDLEVAPDTAATQSITAVAFTRASVPMLLLVWTELRDGATGPLGAVKGAVINLAATSLSPAVTLLDNVPMATAAPDHLVPSAVIEGDGTGGVILAQHESTGLAWKANFDGVTLAPLQSHAPQVHFLSSLVPFFDGCGVRQVLQNAGVSVAAGISQTLSVESLP